MTMYTVMPYEAVWQGGAPNEPSLTTELQIGSLLMQVEPMDGNKAKIVRLLNCELADYLNPLYAPGSTISFIPVIDQNKA